MPSAWVWVIGGGRSQIPFIEAAGERGLNTVVFDRDPGAPAKQIATEFVAMSTHDTDGVIAYLEDHPRDLVGCFTYSSFEGALITTTEVVGHFGVRGLTADAFGRTSLKSEMRRHLKDAGLPVPAWERIEDLVTLEEFRGREGRVMIKPAQGSVGSEGVAVLDLDAADSAEILARACGISSDGMAIVESFIEGPEYSVDGFVLDGQAQVLAVSRKHSGGPSAPFVIGGFVIDGMRSDAGLTSMAGATLAALTLDDSYFSLDVIESGGGFLVIDAGPLLDAKVDRLLHHGGVNVYGIAADIALGHIPDLLTLGSGAHGLRFLYADGPGILLSAEPGRFEHGGSEMVLEMEKAAGDRVRTPQSVSDVLGWVCASGSDADQVWTALSTFDPSDRIQLGDQS